METGPSSPAVSADVPYQTILVRGQRPPRFDGLVPTPFRIAERPGTKDTLIIFPGFGVSVGQIGADRLLWEGAPRYGRLITHEAIDYRTSRDYLLWQYRQLLRELRPRSLAMLGMSLGGSTAVQLLFLLKESEPALYLSVRKLLTLVSPILLEDFCPRWQRIIRLMGELYDSELPRGELSRRIRATALRVVARAIQSRVRRSCMEADSCDEIIGSFGHMADTYRVTAADLPPGGLAATEIVSVGTVADAMVTESRACRYGDRAGRHILARGSHTPDFYAASREEYDRILLNELG